MTSILSMLPQDVLTAGTIAGQPVSGLFDTPYSTTAANGVDVVMTAPQFTVATVDAGGAVQGAQVVIGGTTYWVLEPQPDGQGLTVLLLTEDEP